MKPFYCYLLVPLLLTGCENLSQSSLEDRYSTDINPYLTNTKVAYLDPLSPVAQAIQKMRIREDSSMEFVSFKPNKIISSNAKVASYHMKINKAPVEKVKMETIMPVRNVSTLHKPVSMNSGLHIPGE